jgi:hypothetical protein
MTVCTERHGTGVRRGPAGEGQEGTTKEAES